MDDKKRKFLHQMLDGLTVIVGQCELMGDSSPEIVNRRLRVIEERAKEMAFLVVKDGFSFAPDSATDPQKQSPKGVGRQALAQIRKWASMAAD